MCVCVRVCTYVHIYVCRVCGACVCTCACVYVACVVCVCVFMSLIAPRQGPLFLNVLNICFNDTVLAAYVVDA